MNFLALTGLINFLTSSILGFYVIIKKPGGVVNRNAFFYSLSISLFSIGYFFWQLSPSSDRAMIWWKLLVTGVILINVTFLHFIFTFTGLIQKKKKELLLYYFINAVFIILNYQNMLYSRLEPRFNIGFWPIPLPFFHLYLVFWLWQCLYGLYCLLKNFNNTYGYVREQTKYLTLALTIGFVGGASNWLVWYKIPVPPYANILISISIAIAIYTIIKFRFLDIKVTLSRAGIFLFVYAFVLGIPFYIGFRTNFKFFSFIILFLLSTSGPVIYRYLQEKAEEILFSHEKYYQKFLHETAKNIMKEYDLDTLLTNIVIKVKASVKIDFAAVFLDDEISSLYRLEAIEGCNLDKEIIYRYDHPLIKMLNEKKSIMVHEEFKFLTMNLEKPVHLIIPSFSSKRMLAFIMLGEKFDKSLYTQQDINTFEIFSNQMSLAIDNCIFMKKNNEIQQREFQAEKHAFIGGMAEGVAHRIKNRLNHFSLATAGMKREISNFNKEHHQIIEEIPALKKTFESLKEIGDSLIDNVIRTDQVIQGIINYANTDEKNNLLSKVFFDEIIEGSKNLARIKHDIDLFPINITIESSNIIFGIKHQLIECLYNLLDNSYDAIDEKIRFRLKENEKNVFSPFIHIKLSHSNDHYLIEISDNGVGIRENDKSKLFAPYYTTKTSYKSKSFTGFGLFIVKRIIEENHKGKIWFESTYMSRTTFFIQLPKNIN